MGHLDGCRRDGQDDACLCEDGERADDEVREVGDADGEWEGQGGGGGSDRRLARPAYAAARSVDIMVGIGAAGSDRTTADRVLRCSRTRSISLSPGHPPKTRRASSGASAATTVVMNCAGAFRRACLVRFCQPGC